MSSKIVPLAAALCVAGLVSQGCAPQPAAAPKPAAMAAATPAPPVALIEAPASSLTPTATSGTPQVSGCELVGKAFGYITPGADITFQGVRYPVEKASGVNNQVILTGPNVRAVFTPKPGGKIHEDASGGPLGLASPEPSGTLRIEVAGHVITTPAKEHCVIFE